MNEKDEFDPFGLEDNTIYVEDQNTAATVAITVIIRPVDAISPDPTETNHEPLPSILTKESVEYYQDNDSTSNLDHSALQPDSTVDHSPQK